MSRDFAATAFRRRSQRLFRCGARRFAGVFPAAFSGAVAAIVGLSEECFLFRTACPPLSPCCGASDVWRRILGRTLRAPQAEKRVLQAIKLPENSYLYQK